MSDNWYAATLIIRIRVGDREQREWTCDEQIHILCAPDDEAAYEKALQLGKQEELSYLNSEGETVYWEFLGLEDLAEMWGSPTDGAEIRSHLFDSRNPLRNVQRKDEMQVFRAQRLRRDKRTAGEIIAEMDAAQRMQGGHKQPANS
jgi:hypothetical protein